MNTHTLPRPARRQWQDRIIVTAQGKRTAEALNTNICSNCGCQFLHDRFCDCQTQQEKFEAPQSRWEQETLAAMAAQGAEEDAQANYEARRNAVYFN